MFCKTRRTVGTQTGHKVVFSSEVVVDSGDARHQSPFDESRLSQTVIFGQRAIDNKQVVGPRILGASDHFVHLFELRFEDAHNGQVVTTREFTIVTELDGRLQVYGAASGRLNRILLGRQFVVGADRAGRDIVGVIAVDVRRAAQFEIQTGKNVVIQRDIAQEAEDFALIFQKVDFGDGILH